MSKIMQIIKKETKGKNYHTSKFSYDSIELPSTDYNDVLNKIMKWKGFRYNRFFQKTINLKRSRKEIVLLSIISALSSPKFRVYAKYETLSSLRHLSVKKQQFGFTKLLRIS